MNDNFSIAEIKKIARNTDRNYHSENLLFIAKKINSPTLKKLQNIHIEHMKQGSLNWDLSHKRHKLSDKLMKELKQKSSQYKEVWSAL